MYAVKALLLLLRGQYERIQEAQLPQRNSAAAAHMYLGWLTDLLMTLGGSVHRTRQNHRGSIIFLHLNALIQKVQAENEF